MERTLALILAHIPLLLLAQGDALNCFNSVEVMLPLTTRQPGVAPAEVSYLDEDDFTFWYKVSVKGDAMLEYYLAPINEKDDYESVVYRYQGPDLCQRLLKDPPRMPTTRTFKDGFSIMSADLIPDSTYYISVLSMNAGDCGHRLVIWTRNDTLQIKAKHRDCTENGPDLLLASTSYGLDSLPNDENSMGVMVNDDVLPTGAGAAAAGVAFLAAGSDSARTGDLEVGDKAVMENIYFYPNTYAFKESARDDLEALQEFMATYPEVSIEIQGHTANNARVKYVDPRYEGLGEQWTFTGTAQELSEKRAQAVSEYLSYRGVDKSRLGTKGFGGDQKLYNVDKDHHDFTKNMRVEIEITAVEEKNDEK